MADLFYAGGVFMWPLTLIALVIIGLAVKLTLGAVQAGNESRGSASVLQNVLLQLGIFSFFLGILSQAIGLMQAFDAIEGMGGVSPAMLAGGLKVSMIAPVYGLMIFLVTFMLWSFLKYMNDRKEVVGV